MICKIINKINITFSLLLPAINKKHILDGYVGRDGWLLGWVGKVGRQGG
jgi:hypothetical protein